MGKIFVLFAVCCLCGCMSLAETGGRILDGSFFAEKTLESYFSEGFVLSRYRARSGREGMILVPGRTPSLTLYLEFDENPDSPGLYPAFCRFLGSSLSGWNEWTADLSGTGSLAFSGADCTLTLSAFEMVEITGGRIRRGDARFSGGEALESLKNRKERIDALVSWMKEFAGPAVFQSQKEFEAFWKPVLLPELVQKKKRPADYSEKNAEWTRAEEIKWNKTYGMKFPEDIAALRNTGALLRDWEEALPWLFLSYQWDDMIRELGGEIRFVKKGS